MPDPICAPGTRAPITPPHGDDVLRGVTGAGPEATAAERRHGSHGPVDPHALSTLVEAGAEVAAHAGEGMAAGAGVLLEGTGVAGAVLGGAMQILGAWLAADEGAAEFDDEMMRGALAAFRGELDDPLVVERRAESPGFDQGARRVEELAIRDHAGFECARQAIAAIEAEGARAVYLGRDSGEAFVERYRTDRVFREGVDRARDEAREHPESFRVHQQEAERMSSTLSSARVSVPVRA